MYKVIFQVKGHVSCAKHGFIPHCRYIIKWRPETHFISAKDVHFIVSYTWGMFFFKCLRQHAKKMKIWAFCFFFAEFSQNYVFGRSMVMIASLNTLRVCAHHHADWDARLILWETIWNQAFSMSEIYNQFRGSGSDRKFKVAVEGIKLTTGFLRYRPKPLLFELASRKSRTLGVDQKLLIFWRPRYIYIYIRSRRNICPIKCKNIL